MRGVLAILCLLLVQIYGQHILKKVASSPGCAAGQCCIQSSSQTLAQGSRAADINGKCQEYFCNYDNTYIEIQCPQWSGEECELEAGKNNALYPDCCQMPVGQASCTTKFIGFDS